MAPFARIGRGAFACPAAATCRITTPLSLTYRMLALWNDEHRNRYTSLGVESTGPVRSLS